MKKPEPNQSPEPPDRHRLTVYAHGESNPGGLRRVYRSDDYGTTWTAMADLPSNSPILSISGDRQNAGKVFIGTDGRGLFLGQ